MRRFFYLPGFALFPLLPLVIFPIACTGTFSLSPPSLPSPANTPTPTSATGCMVSTLAGQALPALPGFTDGMGTAASFNSPQGVAVDSSGNVYVADTVNNLIRKISTGGAVTTFAGQAPPAPPGAIDGTGTAASFTNPYGIAVDSSGNVYVADTGNNAIRKITPSGVVTTLAGSGVPGAANGTGTAATFDQPSGVVVDAAGNVYVADTWYSLIRKITPGGVVTILAGSGSPGVTNGTGTAASFNNPIGVAVDSSGNVYVGDDGNGLIRKITPGGVVTTLAGSGSPGLVNGTGTGASFTNPQGLAVDASGNIYVADSISDVIRKITPGGVVTTLAGVLAFTSYDGPCAVAEFYYPTGVAVDASGKVYVADSFNNLIRIIQ